MPECWMPGMLVLECQNARIRMEKVIKKKLGKTQAKSSIDNLYLKRKLEYQKK